MHVRYSTIAGSSFCALVWCSGGSPERLSEFTERLLNATALETNASLEDIWITLSDESAIFSEGRTKVSLAVACLHLE